MGPIARLVSGHNRVALFLIVLGTGVACLGYFRHIAEIGELGNSLVAGGLVMLEHHEAPHPPPPVVVQADRVVAPAP